MFYYDLNESADQKWQIFKSLKGDKIHKKVIYDISHFNGTIITLSLDKLVSFEVNSNRFSYDFYFELKIKINLWNLKEFSQENSLNTINGYVYSIISSPVDPSKINKKL